MVAVSRAQREVIDSLAQLVLAAVEREQSPSDAKDGRNT